MSKKIAIAFGRMSPITKGHQFVVDKLLELGRIHKADTKLFLSHTTGPKDPLTYKDKSKYAREAFGRVFVKSSAKTIVDALKEVSKQGYTEVYIVAGGEGRIEDFKKMIGRLDYGFDKMEVVSCGDRKDGGECGPNEGVSASRMRSAAKDGDVKVFKEMAHGKLSNKSLDQIFKTISGKEMKMSEETKLDEITASRPRAGGGREAKSSMANLKKHAELVKKYIKQGMDKDAASKKAFNMIVKEEENNEGFKFGGTIRKRIDKLNKKGADNKKAVAAFKKKNPKGTKVLQVAGDEIEVEGYEIVEKKKEKFMIGILDGKFQLFIWSAPTSRWIPQGQLHPTKAKAMADAKMFGEEVINEAKDSYSVYKPLSGGGTGITPYVTVKSFKDINARGAFLGKQRHNSWKETDVKGLKSGKHKLNMVRGSDGKPKQEFIKAGLEIDGDEITEKVTAAQRIKTSLKRGRSLRKGTAARRKLDRGKRITSKKRGKQLKNAAKNAKRTTRNAQRSRLTGGKKLKSGAGGVAKRVRSSALHAASKGSQNRATRLAKPLTRINKKRIISSSYNALINKANESDTPIHVVLEVYERGIEAYSTQVTSLTEEQYAFARVNSFISGGAALEMDKDLVEEHGAGEFGSDELRQKYSKDTPGQNEDINTMFSQYGTGKPEVADSYAKQVHDGNELDSIAQIIKKTIRNRK